MPEPATGSCLYAGTFSGADGGLPLLPPVPLVEALEVARSHQIYAQGVNLTSAYVRDYSVLEERFLQLQNTGARYLFGVRARF